MVKNCFFHFPCPSSIVSSTTRKSTSTFKDILQHKGTLESEFFDNMHSLPDFICSNVGSTVSWPHHHCHQQESEWIRRKMKFHAQKMFSALAEDGRGKVCQNIISKCKFSEFPIHSCTIYAGMMYVLLLVTILSSHIYLCELEESDSSMFVVRDEKGQER